MEARDMRIEAREAQREDALRAGARPRRNRFCENTVLSIHNRMFDVLRTRVLRLIGKGIAVVGQERIALTDAVASGDRGLALLHRRKTADLRCARTVFDTAI